MFLLPPVLQAFPAAPLVHKPFFKLSINDEPTKSSEKRYAHSLSEALEQFASAPKISLLIPGVKNGSIGFCFGPPKSGKTTFLEYLLFCIAATRRNFLGNLLDSPNEKCLFVSYEEYSWGRLERNSQQLKEFSLEEQDLIRTNLIVSNHEMPRYVTEASHWQLLENEIDFHKPGVVVIDSLSRLTLESNGDEEIAKGTMKMLREICDKHNITLFIINHTPKGVNERQLTVSSMSGSRIFMQEADFLIGINRTTNNKRYIKLVCSRYDRDDAETVDTFTINHNQSIELTGKAYEAEILNENDGRTCKSNADLIYKQMQNLGEEDKTVDASQLKFLFEEGSMSKVTFHKSLNKLIDQGLVGRLPGKGKYQLLS